MTEDATQLTLEQRAALWALDFDLCECNQWGTTDQCLTVADYEQICGHCDYTRPLCKRHAAALHNLATTPESDTVPIWRCDRCRRCSADFHDVFHLHPAGHQHG